MLDCAEQARAQLRAAQENTERAEGEREAWTWRGMPGHFIASSKCCFHMTTDIGEHRISTVGCYHPAGTGEPSYENRHAIGAGRLYETMVFKLDGDEIVPSEIDAEGYNDEADAECGHIAMCEKYAALAALTDKEAAE